MRGLVVCAEGEEGEDVADEGATLLGFWVRGKPGGVKLLEGVGVVGCGWGG